MKRDHKMKKVFAVMLSLSLLLTAAMAFAEAPAVTEVHWSDLEATAAQFEGAFAPMADLGLQMYIPASLKQLEIPQEKVAEGVFLSLENEDKSIAVGGQVVKMDLKSFVDDATSKGGQGFKELRVNGMQCVNFNLTGANGSLVTNFAFSAGNGTATVLFSFTPAGAETADIFRVMAGSIQPVK